jgi:outer membrane protein TolC
VARSSQAQSEAQRRDVAELVGAGTLARVEAMRADAQVAAATVAVARAEGAVAVARTALRTLLHRPGDQDIAVTERFGEPLPALAESKDELLTRALQARKEVAALRTIIKSHELRAQAEGGNRFPKLGVGGRFDYAKPNQEIPSFGEEWDWEDSWAVIGTLTWSPNDFAAAGARVGQAEADRAQAVADLQSLEDALRQEVAAAYEDYQAARQAMDAAMTGILAAEESYRVRREQFRAGAAVATDVIDAEAELRRARLELINAAIDVRIARARLDRAVGAWQQA